MKTNNSKENLCDTCMYCIASCKADYLDLKFGDGTGNDNVIQCPVYFNNKITSQMRKEANDNT